MKFRVCLESAYFETEIFLLKVLYIKVKLAETVQWDPWIIQKVQWDPWIVPKINWIVK